MVKSNEEVPVLRTVSCWLRLVDLSATVSSSSNWCGHTLRVSASCVRWNVVLMSPVALFTVVSPCFHSLLRANPCWGSLPGPN